VDGGAEVPAGIYFAFPRAETEAIAQALAEKALLEEDYEVMEAYAEDLKDSLEGALRRETRVRRWLIGAGIGLTVVSGALVISLVAR
jgi:hypothetical protein